MFPRFFSVQFSGFLGFQRGGVKFLKGLNHVVESRCKTLTTLRNWPYNESISEQNGRAKFGGPVFWENVDLGLRWVFALHGLH